MVSPDALETWYAHEGVAWGRWRDTLLAVYERSPSVEELVKRREPLRRMLSRGQPVFVLSVIDTRGMPSLQDSASRAETKAQLESTGDRLVGTAIVLVGNSAISTVLRASLRVLYMGSNRKKRFFHGVEPAATWLVNAGAGGETGTVGDAGLVAAVERLRSLKGLNPTSLP